MSLQVLTAVRDLHNADGPVALGSLGFEVLGISCKGGLGFRVKKKCACVVRG